MNKFQKATSLIDEHYKNNIAINLSPSYGYRSRCEFGYKNNFYTMYSPSGEIVYLETFIYISFEFQIIIKTNNHIFF